MKLLERSVSEMIVCDYCRYRKCGWSKHHAGDPPSSCYRVTKITLKDGYLKDEEFTGRLKIVKRMASYDSEEKEWCLDSTVKNPLTGYDLKRTVEEKVNEWSEDNELQLSRKVDYKEEGLERF